jgi:hypothetical protein
MPTALEPSVGNIQSCGLRPAGDTFERRVNRFEKLDTEPRPSTLVPEERVFEFGRGFGFGSELDGSLIG